MKSKLRIATYMLLAFTFFSSCDSFQDANSKVFEEATKSVDGVWQLKAVSRNAIDITKEMDFSRFRLNLMENGSYTIDNYLPFAVKKNGQWRVDDPQYPFYLILHEDGSNEEIVLAIRYPIVQGKRNFSISITPGCLRNSYTYVFEKVDNR